MPKAKKSKPADPKVQAAKRQVAQLERKPALDAGPKMRPMSEILAEHAAMDARYRQFVKPPSRKSA
jgi:hypothetical protein